MQWSTVVQRDIAWSKLEELQADCVARVSRDPRQAFLIAAEPRPTFTLGRFGAEQGLIWTKAELERRGIEVHRVTRGGQWTYHGPGQVLLYPVASLAALGLSRHAVYRFVKTLSGAVADYVKSLGVAVEERAKPFGLYVADRKLASFGLAFERGISSHGVALYLRSQTAAFEGIHPCGCPGQKSVSLEELGNVEDWQHTASFLAERIKKGFKAT